VLSDGAGIVVTLVKFSSQGGRPCRQTSPGFRRIEDVDADVVSRGIARRTARRADVSTAPTRLVYGGIGALLPQCK